MTSCGLVSAAPTARVARRDVARAVRRPVTPLPRRRCRRPAGQRFCLQVKKFLHQEKSEIAPGFGQDIVIFDSVAHGRVLVLDGVIQLTEKDEFAYQEMITHIPIMAHPNPESVLIIGAGDGGVAREVCRHPGVKTVVQCEIDARVIENAKTYFPETLATVLVKGDPRYKLVSRTVLMHARGHGMTHDALAAAAAAGRARMINYTKIPR